jgi:NAD(P)H-flavin reductase
MISWDMKSKDNQLFFWAQAKKDLFYLDEINEIQNLKTHIYLSREETEEYNYWRIDLTKFKFDKNTEFYICWNPWVVAWSMEYLKKAWYENVFSEKFN